MKHLKPLLVVIAVLLTFTGYSQELPRHVFSSGGGDYESAAMHASWTIGQAEPVATTSQPSVILCPGSQQFDDQMVSVKENFEENEFLVYPNPCGDYVHLQMEFNQATEITYTLYDFSGKALFSKELSGHHSYREHIDLGELAPGMYNLMITNSSGVDKQIKSIKLIRN